MSVQPLTIKLGGGVAGADVAALNVIADRAPRDTVLVHGGGSEVATWSRRLGVEPRFNDGLRVTDPATLEVAVAVLAGLMNTRVVALLAARGRSAVGLTGVDGGLLQLRRRDPALGEVGEVTEAEPALLAALISDGRLPVVSSIGSDGSGALLNVNADEAAGAIAAARGGRLLLCTDVAGVMRDDVTLEVLDTATAEAMLDDGSATAGMRPKLRAALIASCAGCEVRIVDGRSPEAMERALAGEPTGTLVRP